jgi:hypothetical protein
VANLQLVILSRDKIGAPLTVQKISNFCSDKDSASCDSFFVADVMAFHLTPKSKHSSFRLKPSPTVCELVTIDLWSKKLCLLYYLEHALWIPQRGRVPELPQHPHCWTPVVLHRDSSSFPPSSSSSSDAASSPSSPGSASPSGPAA